MTDEVRMTLRLPRAVRDAIAQKARREGMSLNAQIVYLLSVVAGVADPKRRRVVKEGDRRERRHLGGRGEG